MNLKFWKKKKDSGDETIIQVTGKEGALTEIYVKAQSSDKALELFDKLKDRAK